MMKKHTARLFGIFFILSFVSYASGIGLMQILHDSSINPFQVVESKISLIIGAILIGIIHTLCNLGLLLIMFNTLIKINTNLSIMYLILGSIGTFLLALGAVFLLLPISLSETLVQSNHFDKSLFTMILKLSSSGNFYTYQFGMIFWGLGGLLFCYLIYKSQMVPILFPISGCMGYFVFLIGCFLELLGFPYGVIFSLPGGVFEVFLSIWLIIMGFSKRAIITN
jgi:hypothetical protein